MEMDVIVVVVMVMLMLTSSNRNRNRARDAFSHYQSQRGLVVLVVCCSAAVSVGSCALLPPEDDDNMNSASAPDISSRSQSQPFVASVLPSLQPEVRLYCLPSFHKYKRGRQYLIDDIFLDIYTPASHLHNQVSINLSRVRLIKMPIISEAHHPRKKANHLHRPYSELLLPAAAGAAVSCPILTLVFVKENKPPVTFGAATAASCPMLSVVLKRVSPDPIIEVKLLETNSKRLVHLPNAPHS